MSADLVAGLQVAIDLVRNQEAFYARRARDVQNIERSEDAAAALALSFALESIQAALREAERASNPKQRIFLTWEQVRALRSGGSL